LREIKRKAIERQHEVEDKPKGFEKGLKEKDSRLKLRQTLEERIQSLSWPTTFKDSCLLFFSFSHLLFTVRFYY